jgi:hypothetical protein
VNYSNSDSKLCTLNAEPHNNDGRGFPKSFCVPLIFDYVND